VKLLTDLQILGCGLHRNTFGDWDPPGPAGRTLALDPPDSLAVIRGKGEKGKERVENRQVRRGEKGRTSRDKERLEGEGRERKG